MLRHRIHVQGVDAGQKGQQQGPQDGALDPIEEVQPPEDAQEGQIRVHALNLAQDRLVGKRADCVERGKEAQPEGALSNVAELGGDWDGDDVGRQDGYRRKGRRSHHGAVREVYVEPRGCCHSQSEPGEAGVKRSHLESADEHALHGPSHSGSDFISSLDA